MKKLLAALLSLCLLLPLAAAEAEEETLIVLGEAITVNGEAIPEDASAPVYLAHVVEAHGDVPAELAGLANRVVTIAAGGVYRLRGTAADVQIAVRAGEADDVRLILDGVEIACRTSSAIAVYSARDPRAAGEYGVTIELAEGSENLVTGSHTVRIEENDTKLDGAVCSLVSLGFEGSGSLTVEADNEGVEVKYGHMTINGGTFHITAGDDPLNVSEDGVGVLTMNDGYVYSAVRAAAGGEGDGIDSNGWIVFNGGTAINLAHPTSQDGGIDSDMGSTINGGVIVGAGNMYDPIEADSAQLFMMLEFAESTDDLLVVTDEAGRPVFAYDFPHDYMYIAFSTPELAQGATYRVYLGGEIEGEQQDGLYTAITAYTPGRQLVHGAGVAEQRAMGGMQPPEGFEPGQGFGGGRGFGGGLPEGFDPGRGFGGEMPEGFDPDRGFDGEMPEGFDPGQGFGGEMPEDFMPPEGGFGQHPGGMPEGFTPPEGGMGGMPRGMESSSEVATDEFVLTRESCTFSNLTVK